MPGCCHAIQNNMQNHDIQAVRPSGRHKIPIRMQIFHFSSNTFARVWKLAEVIPVKLGDADDPSNTRPISLLPIRSKRKGSAFYR